MLNTIKAGRGRRTSPRARKQLTPKECTCPKCGHVEKCIRGVPCTEYKCPKCDTIMKGPNCK